MKFRPCIDIHNGSVKQIVGGSLQDQGSQAVDNFISEQDAAFYADKYKEAGLKGGHIILLNPAGSEYYEKDIEQARKALMAYPGGMQIGGGMHTENAKSFLNMGASHVIVTSYVFRDGKIDFKRLEELVARIGKEHLVLDLSCRFYEDDYYIVTDRWQKRTSVPMNQETFERLARYCDEFLIHAVDVEGKAKGIEKELVKMLGEWGKIPVTYAGGVGSFEDLLELKKLGNNRLNVTIGSALDLFGGPMAYDKVLQYMKKE